MYLGITRASCFLFGFFLIFIYLIIWLHWVLVVACRIFTAAHRLLSSCGACALELTGSVVAPWHVGS